MEEVPVPAAVRDADRWELVEDDSRRLGSKRLVTVDSRRVLYDDHRLRERVRTATGIDRLWRAYFCSEITTDPPLTPGVADVVVRTIAGPKARKALVADLTERGFQSVEKAEAARVQVDTGERAYGTRFSGAVPVDDAPDVDVDVWLAVWDRESVVLAAGGIYPVEPLRVADAESPFAPPEEYRERLFELVRATGRTN